MDSQAKTPKLLDRVRQVVRLHHYSLHTERTYVDWIKRYVRTRGLQARRTMLASGSCWIPRAGFTRALFAFHRPTPLAPATSVLTGADKAKRITRRDPHKAEIERMRAVVAEITAENLELKKKI